MVLIALKREKVLRLPLRSYRLYNRISQFRFDTFVDVSIGTTIRNSVHRAVSIELVRYKRASVNYVYIDRPVHLFIDIDSHEEVYLSSPNASFRYWSSCGQLSSSCTNAISMGGSCGLIRLVRLGLSGSAFVPLSLIPK